MSLLLQVRTAIFGFTFVLLVLFIHLFSFTLFACLSHEKAGALERSSHSTDWKTEAGDWEHFSPGHTAISQEHSDPLASLFTTLCHQVNYLS